MLVLMLADFSGVCVPAIYTESHCGLSLLWLRIIPRVCSVHCCNTETTCMCVAPAIHMYFVLHIRTLLRSHTTILMLRNNT